MDQAGVFSKLQVKWLERKFVCVGLDPDFDKIPKQFKEGKSVSEAIFSFNQYIIDQTADLVCAYKPNSAFYEAEGLEGWKALFQTVKYIKEKYPDIFMLLDAKRADIGNTNLGYVKSVFDQMDFDALTLHPYLGYEAIAPFLTRSDKGAFILVRTSNPGAGEFQDLTIDGKPLYQIVAEHVAKSWNNNGNVGIVVGATYPNELKTVRQIVGDLPILMPGIGAQGGELTSTVKNGINSHSGGMLISSSRGIIFSPNPRETTLKMHEDILNSLQ